MYARSEMNKTKEQLAEDKEIALQFRIKPLDIEGCNIADLKKKAQALWDQIVQLESDKYDLEERQKRQDYDVSIHTFSCCTYYILFIYSYVIHTTSSSHCQRDEISIFISLNSLSTLDSNSWQAYPLNHSNDSLLLSLSSLLSLFSSLYLPLIVLWLANPPSLCLLPLHVSF